MKPNSVVVTSNGPQRYSSPAPVALVKTDPTSNCVTVSQSSQLKSNTLNQYPLLKNLSNQITVTPVSLYKICLKCICTLKFSYPLFVVTI